MKTYKIVITFCTLLFFVDLNSQEVLTVDKAIKIALEKNYDVQISKNDTKIAKADNSIYNNGYLPKVSGKAGVSYANETQSVVFNDPNSPPVSDRGLVTESYNASITAEYTIFDGLERKFNNQKNDENLTLKKLQEKQRIENTIISIYQEYYNVAFQKQVVENLKSNIENSKDRLQRTEKKLKYGQGNKLEELNAKVDLNNDSISYANANKEFRNAKRKLNLLLGRNVTQNFQVDTTVIFLEKINKNEILASAKENNIVTTLSKQNLLLSDLDVKVNKAKYLPKVSGSAGYNWLESINPPTGFAIQNEAYGVNLGLNLTWNIFDGGSNKNRITKAKITKENREIELYKAEEELTLDIYNSYEDYQDKLFTLKAEKKNLETNELNFSRSKKQFSLGQISAVEFRQAQINLFNAQNNVAKAKYDIKISEIILLQLAGKLID